MSAPSQAGDGRDGRAAHPGVRTELVARVPASERWLSVAGVTTPVLEAGAGRPVVLLHGIGQFGAIWALMIPALARSHRVIVPDLPGHGASVVEDGRLDGERVLAWLDELIEHTCAEPPVLVGQQGGGAVAARFAASHPDRISRLLLVDSFGLAPFRPSTRLALAMVGFMARPTEHTRDRFLGQCMVDFDEVRDRAGRTWDLIAAYALEGARTPSVKAAGRSLMKAFAVHAVPDASLASIAAPTALIWGRHDPETRLGVGEAASERHGWPLRVIEDCGADPHLEQPGALLRALSDELEATKGDDRGTQG